jgi:hypothetical protein
MDIVDKLKDLSELHLKDELDDEEFRIAKDLLLNHTPFSVSPPPVQLPLPSVQRIPELTGNEYKVSSWGKNSTKKKSIVREEMFRMGKYIFHMGGDRKKVALNVLPGDIFRMYDDLLSCEYRGIVEGTVEDLPFEELRDHFPETCKCEWGGPPDIPFEGGSFNVKWEKFPLTEHSRIELSKLVKDGGKCEKPCQTFTKLL